MGLGRRLVLPGIGAGLLGGLFMIVVMILVLGTSNMGYASPFNLGTASLVFTISPPLAMFPSLMAMMGITLPAPAMASLASATRSGHIPAAMMSKLGSMLMSMHMPAAKVHMIGLLMSGHATNATAATLMKQLSPAARNAVMLAMPVTASHIAVGAILPPIDPMMGLVPQIAFFLAHLLFGLVVGGVLAMVPRGDRVQALLPATRYALSTTEPTGAST